MFQRVNIHSELKKERERIKENEELLLQSFHAVLKEEENKDASLLKRINANSSEEAAVNFINLQPQNIFTINEIKNICARYRLRFLETRHLRYPLPYEAFIRIKEFEKQQQVEIKQFSIMAPAEAFRLDRKTDPLLFAHLGNNRYYLVHQWGNDLSRYRKMLMFPLRNLYTLLATIILVSFAISFFVPKEWIVYDSELYPLMYNFRLFLFFLISTGSFALLVYIGITRNKGFSEDTWNSRWI